MMKVNFMHTNCLKVSIIFGKFFRIIIVAGISLNFKYSTVQKATINESNKLGQGGFGAVYKGYLKVQGTSREGEYTEDRVSIMVLDNFLTNIMGDDHLLCFGLLAKKHLTPSQECMLKERIQENGGESVYSRNAATKFQGKWITSATWNTIVDPLNGESFIKISEVDESGIKPFVESLSKCPKSGIHNPFKSPERNYTLLKAWNALRRNHKRAQPNDGFAKFLLPPDLVHQLPLDWPTRLKIIAGAARGLVYLHCNANPPVVGTIMIV